MKNSKMNGKSLNPQEELLELLKQKFPEVFAEGYVDCQRLKQTLGEDVDLENERYGMAWAGKNNCFRVIQEPTTATLKPARDESVDFDETENLFIEGDNLEVLKILQKPYYGKVKMIYIDPPYNTGNDFIYNDDFKQDKAEYEEKAGVKDGNGDLRGDGLMKNSRDKGHYHSDWLNMMYPRLFLARNLLRQNGVIFVSIDDNEVHNLKMLLNEIFGEDGFINQISIKAKPSAGASGGGEDIKLKKNIEYVLCYSKNRDSFERFNDVYEEEDLFRFIQRYKDEGKSWKYTRVLTSFGEKSFHKEIESGSGGKIKIYKHDGVVIKTIPELAKEEKVSEEKIYIKYFDKVFRDTNAQSSIRQRVIEATDNAETFYSIEYEPTSGRNKGQLTTLYYRGRNKDLIAWLKDVAIKEKTNLIKKEKVGTLWSNFNWNNVSKEGNIQYPNGKKPIDLIKRMIELVSSEDKDDIILDFFAGSASTGHAVYDQNFTDGGKRKCISIQLPEDVSEKDKKKYYSSDDLKHIQTVSDIGIERLKRSVKSYRKESKGKLKFDEKVQDFGFKVFKFDESNFKIWRTNVEDEKSLLKQMSIFVDNVKEESTQDNILYELILKSGLDLNVEVAKKEADKKTYFLVDGGKLAISLEDKISQALVDAILVEKPEKVICLDKAFGGNDQLKTNTLLQMESAKIDFKII